MRDVFDFRAVLDRQRRLRRGRRVRIAGALAASVAIGGMIGWGTTQEKFPDLRLPSADATSAIDCSFARVVDGDTLRCGATRVRLSSIDAPEMPGHCRSGRQCTPGDPWASKANLTALVAGGRVECRRIDTDRYGRSVASCSVRGRDLSCAQVTGGYAVERYGHLSC